MDYLLRFTTDITHIKGDLNKVADCLSQYYKSDTIEDVHMYDEYVCMDACIDLTGEDLPAIWFREMMNQTIVICAMHEHKHRHSTCLHEQKEQHDVKKWNRQNDEISKCIWIIHPT